MLTLDAILESIQRDEEEHVTIGEAPAGFLEHLSTVLDNSVYDDGPGEHQYCDRLSVHYTPDGDPTRPDAFPRITAKVRFSWVHPYTDVIWEEHLDTPDPTVARAQPTDKRWRGEVVRRIYAMLENNERIVVPPALLSELVPDHVSQLDDTPARVYQVLFTEQF